MDFNITSPPTCHGREDNFDEAHGPTEMEVDDQGTGRNLRCPRCGVVLEV